MFHLPKSLPAIVLVVFVTLAAITDLRSHRIPNWMTVPAALAGLAMNIAFTGVMGAANSVLGLFAGMAIFLPLYLARGFGGGDVKAMAAIGAIVGPKAALVTAMWILIAGGISATVLLTALGGFTGLKAMFQRWMFSASVLAITGNLPARQASADDIASRRFPYGLAIAFGTFASLMFPLNWSVSQ